MTNLLKYYIAKRRLPLVIASAILGVLAFIISISTDLVASYDTSRAESEVLWIVPVFMAMLVTLVPIYEFSFKMKKNGIDEYYSLPITRRKLYLTKYIVGILDIVIPFTVSFITMIIVIAFRENAFNMVMFIPYYFVTILAGVCAYTVFVFAYTRGNTVFDGLATMGLYCIIIPVCYVAIENLCLIGNEPYYKLTTGFFGSSSFFFTYSGIVSSSNEFAYLICNYPYYENYDSFDIAIRIICYSVTLVEAGVFFGLFLYLSKHEPAENSEDISNSWFGYKVLIPAFIVTSMMSIDSVAAVFLMGALGLVLYFIYNRGFKLDKAKWITYGASAGVGLILGLIIALV